MLRALHPGVNAVKHHWLPFLLIQAVGAVFVFSYFQSEVVRSAASAAEAFKVSGGIPFAFFAAAFAGGILPEIAKYATGKIRQFDREWFGRVAITALAFGIVGVEILFFYNLQSIVFGTGNDVLTLAKKTFVDMFIVSPLLFTPSVVAMLYLWRYRFQFVAVKSVFTFRFYIQNVVPVLLPCWAFWIPMLFLVYSLPLDLQFVISMLAEAAWSVLIVFIATKEEDKVLKAVTP